MSESTRAFDPATLATFPATFDRLEAAGILTPTVAVERFLVALDPGQREVVDRIMNLSPRDYGVGTPFAGELEPVPADLVTVSGQRFVEDGVEKTIGDRYVPRPVFDAYGRMNDAFIREHPSRSLLIVSCYRSPAYQVAVFIDWLVNHYGGDVGQTIRHASPPRYSEHTIASKAAIDFKNVDGSPSSRDPGDFKDTVEYAWLRRRAGSFGFHESWPEGNEFGMRAEPWHWQYRPA